MNQPSFRLDGKVAIVTGGSKGIGRGLAEVLARAGAAVAVSSRHLEQAEAAAAELRALGAEALALRADVKQRADVEAMVQAVRERFGRIDVLVNNAGTVVAKPALDLTEEDWDHVLDTNLKGAFLCSQAAGRVMIEQGGGSIINIASIMGAVGDVALAAYCASKGGVVLLTKALAAEWARHGVRVNAIGPGYIKTDFNREALKDERILDRILRKTPLRRLCTIEDLAGTCLLLASDAGSYITGQTFYIDGGWTAV
ncbi:MAG TPA: 3-oxoacyl-ACP reductase family protein [Bacillota bacterium]